MASKQCPACSGSEHRFIEKHGDYEIFECSTCGLQFSNPMIAGSLEFYKSHDVYNSSSDEEAEYQFKAVKNRRKTKILDALPPRAKTLDIGCGYGAFVALARDHGFDAYGVDFNDEQISIGAKYFDLNGRLISADLRDLNKRFEFNSFDLITFFEVIEHVEDPTELLAIASSLLKPGGRIALSCPNESRWKLGGRIFVDFPPHHLTRWTPASIRSFLKRQGLTDTRLDIESNWRDLVWTYLVNKQADARSSRDVESADIGPSAANRSKIKRFLFDVFGVVTIPFNLILKLMGVGTMGMHVVATYYPKNGD